AYVCSVNLNGLQTAFTVCRESCPASNRSKYRCREKPSRYDNETAVDAEVADYATETIPFQLSNLCVPMEMQLMNHLFAYHAKEAAEVRIYVVLKRMIVPLLVASMLHGGVGPVVWFLTASLLCTVMNYGLLPESRCGGFREKAR
ncbi:CIPK9, partial [Symbiodinium sp. CCMP2456]